jgi:adenosylcobinamide kinase/adenosylcobinamide-phosphate guanylyltransferase
MMSKEVILIGGGVRSGKSELALRLARGRGSRRVFVATAEPRDAEMEGRIAQHRIERGPDFETIEVPLDVPECLCRIEADVVVLDCVTLWLSNLLCRGDAIADVVRRVDDLAAALARRTFDAIVVTNEVGMGLVPEAPLGRAFRDVVGIAHQRVARVADRIYFGALGVMLRLRPGPIAALGASDEGSDEAPSSGWTCS